MPLSDKKKCQTLINKAVDVARTLQSCADSLATLRSRFQEQNVSAAGTPLEGHIAAISAWIDDVQAAATNPVATGLIAHYRPTHGGNALGV